MDVSSNVTDQSVKDDVVNGSNQIVVDNNNGGDNLVCRERLTEEQSERLRNELQKGLQLDQDVLDYTLAMLSNEKSVGYIVKELLDTELCPKAQQMGHVLIQFLSSLPPPTAATTAASSTTPFLANSKEDKTNTNNEINDNGSRVIALKSTKKSNALTMSGALGSSRQGGKSTKVNKNNYSSDPNRMKKKKGDHPNETNKKSSTLSGEAFERLSSPNNYNNNNDNNNNKRTRRRRDGGNKGGRNNNNNERGGRGGNRGGRGGGDNNNNNNRLLRGNHQRGGNYNNQNNNNESHHMNPEKDNLPKSKRFRPALEDPTNNDNNATTNNNNDNSKEYSQNHYNRSNNFHSFPNRSWRGANTGRGEAEQKNNNSASENATLAAAEASPSPLVAATFGGRFGGGGRGGRGGRFGGGRFFGGGRQGGRMHVQAMLASKTWTRQKPTTNTATAGTTSNTINNPPTTD